ncbi:GH39 family glycosyl hydrolase [Phytoactinopolyspora halotolerans]|uniref:Xylan 1,4-beta-xylosidase n=1 Tax=Phytoactinopolyspora halotolerans TaxID=1981512 RepID=A0A6L9S4W4_9ACTN|nr:xylan 1,4-beta-xylosidase [Phytoactinopolyspora halotolerans]NED99537.1 xylan 1,4-beta-xylosidase [Phytoactinopolyspora halotolerans]
MRVDVPVEPVGVLGEAWRECVGTGRAELALRADYLESLAFVQEAIGFRHVRGHGLFSDGMGVYREYDGATGRAVRHSFTYVDRVVEGWLSRGIRPFLELGFMPSDLASGDQTVFWWRGNVTPPRSYIEWGELVSATVRHLVDRYGLDEVRRWPIEVWNEPNLDIFWRDADQDEYHRLYEVTARAVKDVDAELQVGGPSLAPGGDEWWEPFAEFVTAKDVPIDFVSRHAYTSGPAQPVPFGVYQTLRPPSSLLEQFAAPRWHLHGTALADLPVHITEFNSSYRPDNPIHDTAYNAAYLAPVLAGGGELVDSFSYWTFCDIFEEVGVPTSFFHGGFGLVTHGGIAKPTFHLYAFMARCGRHVLARGDDHLVTRDDDGRVAILAWQPVGGSDDGPYGSAPERHRIGLDVPVGGQLPVTVVRRRVDEERGNAWTLWRELGAPRHPSRRRLELLREASQPGVEHFSLAPGPGGRVTLDLTLARHEVTLVELLPAGMETGVAGVDGAAIIDDGRLLGHSPADSEDARR